MRRNIARDLFTYYVAHPPSPLGDWPEPTYVQLYLYALTSASHVHFTFKEGESLAGL